MGNLYSLTKTQDEIRRAFRIDADHTGHLPPLPGIFRNTAAPIVHVAEGQRVLSMSRWGMPSRPSHWRASGSIRASPTYATPAYRTGAAGSGRSAAASSRSPPSSEFDEMAGGDTAPHR